MKKKNRKIISLLLVILTLVKIIRIVPGIFASKHPSLRCDHEDNEQAPGYVWVESTNCGAAEDTEEPTEED